MSRQIYIKNLLLLFLSIILISCDKQTLLYSKLSKEDRHNIHYQGHYKVGKQYQLNGKTYTPAHNHTYRQVGIASWYRSGKKTANGDKYNKSMLTAAHGTLPLPSLVKVTNLENEKTIIVMVNDRGPFAKGRILDVSEKAAEQLAFKEQGVTKVKVQYLYKETQEFLHNLALAPKHGAVAKNKVKNPKCSINCHIKLVNLKHKLAID